MILQENLPPGLVDFLFQARQPKKVARCSLGIRQG